MMQFDIKDLIGWAVGLLAIVAGVVKWLFIQHDKDLSEKILYVQTITEKMRDDIKDLQLEMIRSHSVFLDKADFSTWRREVKEMIDAYNNDQKETLKRLFQLIEKIDDKKEDKKH